MSNKTTQPNPINESSQYAPISIGEWIITSIILAIPIVGFVMLFVWGFGSNTQPSKANWAKATLIMIVISFVIALIFFGSIFGVFFNLIS
tara:strand:+ start:198 stop:467 length:270 start_codon:yes stop_codon:yes gene_type:complete